MTAKSFLKFVKKECKKHGVKFLSPKTKGVEVGPGIIGNGYFMGGDDPEMAVAMGKKESDWLRILVHEYCHMRQWVEDAPCFTTSIAPGVDALDLFDLWLSGHVELTEKQKKKVFDSIMKVELDCEKRALKIIDEMDLPMDKTLYAKRANSYVLFYEAIKKTRKWYKIGDEPYNDEELYSKMPDKLIRSTNGISKKALAPFFKKYK